MGHPSEQLIIRGVTVVDARDGSLTAPVDVATDGGRIIDISSNGGSPPDGTATIVDGSGKFLVPGFIDMQYALPGRQGPSGALALLLANGVTGFRQMSGSDRLLQQAAGTLPMTDASPARLAMPGELLTPVNARTEKDAVAAVRQGTSQRPLAAPPRAPGHGRSSTGRPRRPRSPRAGKDQSAC